MHIQLETWAAVVIVLGALALILLARPLERLLDRANTVTIGDSITIGTDANATTSQRRLDGAGRVQRARPAPPH